MPATPAAAPVTPVKVSVPAVAKVVVPDATQPTLPAAAASAPAVSPAVAPVIPVATRSTPAVASFKKQHPVERAHKKKHHATNHEDDDGGNGAEQSQPVKTVQPQHNATDSSDYTEIKGMGSSQTLVAAVQASATAPAPSRVVTDDGFKPAIVATAGGKAWVKISPARTIAVKSGDSVPGLGKVESVTDSAVVTEKGKFSVNTKE
jgi:hypothetical protein